MLAKPKAPDIKHHVDPMRFPKVQGAYEGEAKKSFEPIRLFGDIVEVMTKIVKDK